MTTIRFDVEVKPSPKSTDRPDRDWNQVRDLEGQALMSLVRVVQDGSISREAMSVYASIMEGCHTVEAVTRRSGLTEAETKERIRSLVNRGHLAPVWGGLL